MTIGLTVVGAVVRWPTSAMVCSEARTGRPTVLARDFYRHIASEAERIQGRKAREARRFTCVASDERSNRSGGEQLLRVSICHSASARSLKVSLSVITRGNARGLAAHALCDV